MKRITGMFLCVFAFASQASAACPTTGDIIPLSCGVVPQTSWNPYGAAAPLTADELKAQRAAGITYHEQLRARIIANGGCNADTQPFWIASHCSQEAFGLPMGSEGGD